MTKKCPVCKTKFDGNAKKKYCGPKCKKKYENSLRSAPKEKAKPQAKSIPPPPSPAINRPQGLNQAAAAYWDKVAPTVIARGHLNVLSEDSFAELCDLHSRLADINTMINMGTVQKCSGCGSEIAIPGNRSLLQIDDKWSANDNSETRTFKESALSDLKRKYSKQYLDYCKQFYLTPMSNRGNFGLDDADGKEDEAKTGKERFF
jgi:hypothetical protein